jgi:hypothetical protein
MQSGTLRGLFFLLMILCILGIVLYTQKLVGDLREEARGIVEFYAKTLQRIASDEIESEALGWFYENIIQKTNFPLILADAEGNPKSWKDISVPENDRSPAAERQVRNIMDKMAGENEPVPITYMGSVISYLYYGDSTLITRLVFLPYITLSGLGLLVLTAFLGFSSIKRSEQRFIWVGMAKETAHQLGTPISSLMGWLEIVKTGDTDGIKVKQIVGDMESDVKRLEKVAARFSQIGSRTDLKKQDIHQILGDTMAYFHRRLPQNKEIMIEAKFGVVRPISLNRELFEWAIENLIKNAIDAVKKKKGLIEITTGTLPDNGGVYIDIRDNGTGINAKRRRDIFKAGYSTKKRGWGLGLNFTKRIIEDYHHGRLFIKDSQINKGTTMRIVL